MAGLVHKWIEFLDHSQYKSVFDIAEKQLNGEKRQADDFQSVKNLKDEFKYNRTSLTDQKSMTISLKFEVQGTAKSCILGKFKTLLYVGPP